MGWQNYHLYEFSIPKEDIIITSDKESIPMPMPQEELPDEAALTNIISSVLANEGYSLSKQDLTKMVKKSMKYNAAMALGPKEDYHSAQRTKIDKYMKMYKIISYIYDFGDDWEHKITVEKIIDNYVGERCVVLKGKGDCPPEDVGGIWGYKEFLKVYNDKNNIEHENTVDWADMQCYQKFNIDACNEVLKKFMKVKKGK